MIPFKLNSKPFKMPSSWDDARYDQYLKTFDVTPDTTTTDMLSIFLDIDVETLKKSKFSGLDQVLTALSFVNTPLKTDGYCKKVGPYELPGKDKFDIQFEGLDQFEDMRAIMNKLPQQFRTVPEMKLLAEAFPKFVAIYLQKIRDGEYSYSKAVEMEAEVLKMPAKEVVITGGFFYLKLTSLLNGTPKTSPPTPRSPKKSRQALKRSGKRSGCR